MADSLLAAMGCGSQWLGVDPIHTVSAQWLLRWDVDPKGSVLATMGCGSLWFSACCDPNGSVLAATGCGAYPHHNGSVVAAMVC